MNVNLRTAFLITQESIKILKKNENGGNLVHIVSSSAKVQSTNKAPYGIAKAAQARLIQYAAGEAAKYNIRINGRILFLLSIPLRL